MAPVLQTKYVFSLAIKVGTPIVAGDLGYGVRRVIAVLGGEVRGPGMKGTIFPVGADFQTIRPNGFTELEAKYAFEMDDGAVIYIENIGIRFGPKELLDRITKARPSIPRRSTSARIPVETDAENYRWLIESLFVGVGAGIRIVSGSTCTRCCDAGRDRHCEERRRPSNALASDRQAKQSFDKRGEASDCFVAARRSQCRRKRQQAFIPPIFVIKHNYSEQDVIDPMGNTTTAAAADRSAQLRSRSQVRG